MQEDEHCKTRKYNWHFNLCKKILILIFKIVDKIFQWLSNNCNNNALNI